MRNIYILLLLTFGLGQDYSLQFDNNGDYVKLPANFIIDSEDGLTFSIDIKTDWDEDEYIIDMRGDSGFRFNLGRCCGYNPGFGMDGVGGVTYPEFLNMNDWMRITGLIENSGSVMLYINGELVGEEMIPSDDYGLEYGNPKHLGAEHNLASWQYYNGAMDNFVVWNRVLDINEINSVSLGEFPEENMMIYYKFDANDGSTAVDYSGNGMHGEIFGNTVYTESVLVTGCTDPLADNYNPDANVDDGSCEYEYPQVDFNLFNYGGQFEGNYYYLSNQNELWVDAKYNCENQSGHLATVSSESENIFLTSLITNSHWIGFSDSGSEGSWYWVTNEEISYTNWGNGEPNNTDSNEDYCLIKIDGTWNDERNYETVNYILEIEGEITTGCTNPEACNYDETANVDDGSCLYNDECGICGGPGQQMWYDDEDADGIGDCNDSEYSCDGSGIYNYNPPSLVCGDNCPNTYDPTFSDSDEDGLGDVCDDQPYCATNNEDACGVCQGDNSSCSGCTDPYASNFNEEANVDDGSCTGYPDNGDYSLSFDGVDDYVDIINISIPSGSSSRTIEAWINYIGNPDCCLNNGSAIFCYGEFVSDRAFGFRIKGGNNDEQHLGIWTHGTNFGASAQIPFNEFIHVAVSINDSSETYFYVNGNLIGIKNININTGIDGPVYIGKTFHNSNDWLLPFNGKISELKVSNNFVYSENFIPSSFELDENTEALYKFNAGSGDILYDHSGNQNHGTIHGATWVENIYGCTDSDYPNYNPNADFDDGSCEYPDNGDYSLSFDGVDDYVDLGLSNDFNSPNMTINAWIKLNGQNNGDRAGHAIFAKNGDVSNSYQYNLKVLPENVSTWGMMDANSDGQPQEIEDGSVITDNKWYFITGTYDGEYIKLYINGELSGTPLFVSEMNVVDINTFIGKFRPASQGGGHHFKGYIDKISYWDKALFQEEIQSIMLNEPNNEEDLIAHYKFNAGEGNTLYDHSGNGNHGAINGATWYENTYGCTDSYADNHNPDANWDDGSCTYPDNGDYSLSFDGVDDYVVCPNSGPTGSNPRTILFDAIVYNDDFSSLVTYPHNNTNDGELFNVGFNWGHGSGYPDVEGLTIDISGSAITYSCSVNDGEWHSYAVVVHSSNITDIELYQDGILLANISRQYNWNNDVVFNTQEGPLVIGNENSNYFNGLIDNLSIFGRALSIDEINQYIEDDNNLLSHYKFNAGYGDILYDHSGNGNHGTINGATWYMEGCTNPLADNYNHNATVDDGSCEGEYVNDSEYALSFDGVDDWVECGNEMNLNLFTIESIFKTDELNGYIVSKHILGSYDSSWLLYYSNGYLKIYFTDENSSSVVTVTSTFQINDSEWHNVAAQFDGETLLLYIDGLLDNYTETLLTPRITNTQVGIGSARHGGNEAWDVSNIQIDQIKISDIPLYQGDGYILNQYTIDENTIALWNFNAGEGDILYDHSGNGNHGTIHGNPDWVLINNYGCSSDSDACNYEEGGNFTNEICLYDDCEGVCGGESLADNCGECGGDNSTCDIQSTEVAIYYFSSVTLDGLYPSEIIARNEESGMVVGSGSYGNVGDGITEVMVYGVMGEDYVVNTTGLMTPGLTPQFYVDGQKAHYVASGGDILQDIPAFYSYQFYIDLTLDLETDCNGDMGGSAVTTGICGDCWGGTTGYDQDYNDPDGDGICNAGAANGDADNCPNTANAEQANYDSDSEGDACDADIDDDGALNDADSDDYNIYVCSDSDADTCEDCLNGYYNPSDDGWDYDGDGLCDDGDPDDDNDCANDDVDSDDNNQLICSDDDNDTCDDCSSSCYDVADDGWDYDQDGACDDGDDDDDNDGALDDADSDDNNEFICSDNDNDTCDDCSDGSYGLDDDGEDNDTDGWCNDGDMWPDCSNEILDEDPNDQCGNCHGDGFADDCVGNNDCNDMDCAGLCGQVNQQDDCSVCDDNYNNDCYDLSIILDDISLISFPALPGSGDYSVGNIFSQLCDNPIIGMIGEGSAFVNWGDCQFIGSLSDIVQNEGYWVMLSTSPDTLFIDEAIPVSYDADGEVVYEIHYGNNLISYPFQTSQYLEDALGDVADSVYALVGEGIAALNTDNGWLGTLTAFEGGKGYWLITSYDFNFKFNGVESGLARIAEQPAVRPVPEAHRFAQSSRQAFYFIQTAIIRHEPLDEDDIIIAYNGDVVVGARYWNGEYTDVPAMGIDDYSNNEGYCKIGDQISFKVWDSSASKLIDMQADVGTTWNDISVSVINLTEILPEFFSLDRAYPNPFNPVTTLSFAIPVDSEVSLSIYNLQGREVSTLISGYMDAGYHSVIWNADSHSSGVYFVKMVAGNYVNTQKLMLVK